MLNDSFPQVTWALCTRPLVLYLQATPHCVVVMLSILWKYGALLIKMLSYLLVSLLGVFYMILRHLLEPGFDYLHALAPYQPLNMKVCCNPNDL